MTIDSAFTHFPILTTARLRLRALEAGDAEAVFAIKSDAAVTWQYGQEPHKTPADSLGWITRLQADYPRRDCIAWGITLHGEQRVIGVIVLWNFQQGWRCAELGYELRPAYHGQGIMSEAVRAVLAWGFDELELHRVEACPLAENEASVKFLEKLGFQHEGTLRQRVLFHGRFIDQLYYGLVRYVSDEAAPIDEKSSPQRARRSQRRT